MRTLQKLLPWRRFDPLLRFLAVCALVIGCHPAAADKPACNRVFSLSFHDHGLLYSAETDSGIDKDFAEALIRKSGCKFQTSVMPRARIWQLIESGALDFSLSGITNPDRDRFASFAWYFSNRYYLLVRKDAVATSIADFVHRPGLRLGVIRSFRYGESANKTVDQLQADARVDYASGLGPLYQLLMNNRIQGMVIEPFDFPALDEKKIRAATEILEFNDPSIRHGVIMSRKALAQEEQEKWRALVDELRADGTVQRIFDKYFKPNLAAEMTRF